MKNFTLFLLFTLFISTSYTTAQQRGKVTYTALANRAASPNFFFESIVIPDQTENQAQLIFSFRMDNSFIPFKKISTDNEITAPKNAEFYSIARLNTEIFEGKASKRDLKNLSTVSRDIWKDTLFAETYDDTKSKKKYATGRLVTELKPGMYNYVLQLSLMESNNDRNSQRTNIEIEDFNTKKTGEVYLIKSGTNTSSLQLINMGDNVIYGDDYQVLVRIPNYNSSENYSLDIYKARISKDDTTNTKKVKTLPLEADRIFENSSISLLNSKLTSLALDKENGTYTYALVEIPNSEFENAVYNLELVSESGSAVLAKKLVRSYWPDIPPSLLNLDISIEMMKFIISEEELKNMKKGNAREKEKKFREFWSKRDPTPNTEFNELMTEYYRRVHYAFVEYRSPEIPNGQDTDRGEIYIKYGPPNSTDRTFPKKGKVIETWTYDNRSFVFEKAGGFSEFILLGK